jgi:hypothetical protein
MTGQVSGNPPYYMRLRHRGIALQADTLYNLLAGIRESQATLFSLSL